MSDRTYGQLEAALVRLGFVLRESVPESKWFEHPESGAVVAFPTFPPDQPLLDRHLVMTRAVLDAYGYPDPFATTGQPQQAG